MKIDSRQLAIYIVAVVLPVIIIVALLSKIILKNSDDAPAPPDVGQVLVAQNIQPISAVAPEPPITNNKAANLSTVQPVVPAKSNLRKSVDEKSVGSQVKQPVVQPKNIKSTNSPATSTTESYISINCKEGTQLFVDGANKGQVTSSMSLTVTVSPGKHHIIVTGINGSLYTQDVELEPGKTIGVKPSFCS